MDCRSTGRLKGIFLVIKYIGYVFDFCRINNTASWKQRFSQLFGILAITNHNLFIEIVHTSLTTSLIAAAEAEDFVSLGRAFLISCAFMKLKLAFPRSE